MKMKLTRKEVLTKYNCYQVGYCKLQCLLKYNNAVGYTAGVYGWNADVYLFDNLAIVTGNRPFGKQINSELVKKYEEKARENAYNYDLTYEQRKRKINNLLNKFIEEVKEG